MTARIVLSVLIATLLAGVSTSAQSPGGQPPLAGRFVDSANGLSLEQAIARAIEQEPSLRAARSQVEVAQGTKLQGSVRPNPSVSFERRQEPGGTDHLTTVGVEWPLSFSGGERPPSLIASSRPQLSRGCERAGADVRMCMARAGDNSDLAL
jgi:cobalt-zinc-cadmium efflux system outer membrane protein